MGTRCCCGTCSVQGRVLGCTPLEGVTVTVSDHSSHTVLGTATSNASGAYLLTGNLRGRTVDISVPASGRYASASITTTLPCVSITNLTVPPASGYVCFDGCGPIKTTLQGTGTGGILPPVSGPLIYDPVRRRWQWMIPDGGSHIYLYPDTQLCVRDGFVVCYTLAPDSTCNPLFLDYFADTYPNFHIKITE